MITVVDRSRVPLLEKVASGVTFDAVAEALAGNGRVLVYLNRRGGFRAYLCEDCSHQWACPRCDVGLTAHLSPTRRLVCHHCRYEAPMPDACPKCGGTRLSGV